MLWLHQTTPSCQKRLRSGQLSYLAACSPRHLELIYEINHRFLEQVKLRLSQR